MSRNGSGTYSLPVNSWNPAANGVPATAADWQALINDVASAITQSVSRDGQTPLTGNLPMGSNKLTGLAAGTAAGDSLRFEQLFSQGQPQDLASAATTDIGAQLTTVLNITGTTTITSFGTNYNGPRFLRFAGALTLTHGAALVLPGAANITTAAGDAAIVVPLGTPASGWRVVAYQRASGEPIALADGSITLAKLASSAYGTSGANKLLQLDGTGKLPPVDGSQLTGLNTFKQIQPISASVAANALTLTLNPTTLDFRSATLGSGTVNTRTVGSAINLTISSGSTLGTANATSERLAVLAIDNAGTVELAVTNLSGGVNLDETTLISTTAEGGAGAADSASVIYSTTARSNVPFRVVGFIGSTQATAGTWATAPSTIQGAGGQALAALSSFGYGQTWQDVKVSRAIATTYYNTTGKPIFVWPTLTTSTGSSIQVTVNGVVSRGSAFGSAGGQISAQFVVPHGGSYSVTANIGSPSIDTWAELRS